MEFGDHIGSNKDELWGWPGEEYYLHRDSQNDFSCLLWNEVNQNELLCLLDDHTPVKDCADLEYLGSNVDGDANKWSEECRESLQLKRRRMLQFTRCPSEKNFASEQMNTSFFKSKAMECSMTEVATSKNLQWNGEGPFTFQDDTCAFTCEELDQPSDGWLMDCFSDNAIHCSSDEMKSEVVVNKQADISECYDNSLEMETDIVQETPPPAPLRVSKGKQAYIIPPRKLNASVAYPFALIKPCGVHGDVTLNDINQRIHAPPPSSLKHKKDEDPSINFHMSAFSGKPVVMKTKIHTEGGQGSITIMRTKG